MNDVENMGIVLRLHDIVDGNIEKNQYHGDIEF